MIYIIKRSLRERFVYDICFPRYKKNISKKDFRFTPMKSHVETSPNLQTMSTVNFCHSIVKLKTTVVVHVHKSDIYNHIKNFFIGSPFSSCSLSVLCFNNFLLKILKLFLMRKQLQLTQTNRPVRREFMISLNPTECPSVRRR